MGGKEAADLGLLGYLGLGLRRACERRHLVRRHFLHVKYVALIN